MHSSFWTDGDYHHMSAALGLARQAELEGEVPVGAIIVADGEIIGAGRNRSVSGNDPTAHAEMEAIRTAANYIRNYRLTGATLFVTLEPCAMCAGALVAARIARLVFATRDIRFGAVRSKFRIADSELLNHRVDIEEGLMAPEASELLGRFFRARRSPQSE